MLNHTDRTRLEQALRAAIPGMDDRWYRGSCEKILRETDERLEPNLEEWIAGDSLSDIWIGDYCVGMVLTIRGSTDVLAALEALSVYARDPERGERLIWRTVK